MFFSVCVFLEDFPRATKSSYTVLICFFEDEFENLIKKSCNNLLSGKRKLWGGNIILNLRIESMFRALPVTITTHRPILLLPCTDILWRWKPWNETNWNNLSFLNLNLFCFSYIFSIELSSELIIIVNILFPLY